MRNQGQLLAGIIIIAIGVAILFGNVFNINLWAICWPTGMILLGLWLLLRPQLAGPNTGVSLLPLGDVQREGPWTVRDEEIWMFVGDIDLDLTQAIVPPGETRFRVFKFVGDVELLAPADIGLSVSSTAFVSSVKAFGDKVENFLVPVHMASDNYETAERRVRLEVLCFVGDVKVRQV